MISNKIRAAVGMVSTALAVGVALSVAQPAQAAPAYISVSEGACSSGYVCLWDWDQYQLSGFGYYNDVWNLATISSPYNNMNNSATSAKNRSNSGNAVKFYDNAGGSGTARCLRAGYSVPDMYPLDNKASALVWSSGCGSVAVFQYS
ncbi:peptidase inhibitor family I36 protein [Micromonospora zamorensis]|uniref:peptidase inhibitor family I36 protein n=1 Tax=Micromonospora zamorensis TaxID=709883 RepID=UPI002ED1E969|nr:peptidase inhibitor family I36 protein [Micromonospora zamorensis]